MLDATGDDSVFCNLCDPPHETSLAMIATHLAEVHGLDPSEIATAEVLDATDPRTDCEEPRA